MGERARARAPAEKAPPPPPVGTPHLEVLLEHDVVAELQRVPGAAGLGHGGHARQLVVACGCLVVVWLTGGRRGFVAVSRGVWVPLLLDLVLLPSFPLLVQDPAQLNDDCRLGHPHADVLAASGGPGAERERGDEGKGGRMKEQQETFGCKGERKRTVHGDRAQREQPGNHQAARGNP